jgi:cephalosporin-C deacetylase-like acetyl esterase
MAAPLFTLRTGLLAILMAQGPAGAAESLLPAPAPDQTPRAQLERSLNALGERLLQTRREAVAALASRDDLERRRTWVRETVLGLIGGLPSERTPLRARVTGRHEGPGFTVENVIFESLPGFPVTANLYRPAGATGRLPALLASMGHGELGKAGERLGPDLARHGFVVLQYDPLGQGERLQHYDADLRVSRAGSSTDEHGQAAALAELVGESVARYFVWDAVRGLDYLEGRPDVDPQRLGAIGCSGGGTVTTYLAALDERVKAAAVACYVTSWSALLTGPGPQEAEQSLAGFLAQPLDMGDYVALIAPRPLVIVSTEGDFFPLKGAETVYEEGKRLYGLLGAPDRITWSTSPGGHGISPQGRVAVAEFFLRWLRPGEAARDLPDARLHPEDLACTESGQVSVSLHATTVAQRIAADAAALPRRPLPGTQDAWRAYRESVMRAAVHSAAGDVSPRPSPPALTVHRSLERAGYRLDAVSFPMEEGLTLWGLLAVPRGQGRRRGVLLADPGIRADGGDVGGDLDQLAAAGHPVLALELRGALTDADPAARPSLLGPLAGLQRRAAVAGKSLAGLRVLDVLGGVDVLASQAGVDGIDAFGRGPFAIPVLHAALLDPRVARVAVQDAPVSYRVFLDHPIHRDLPEVVIPGVLRHYDLPDLMLALSPVPVMVMSPTDAVGRAMKLPEARRYLADVLEADRRLGGGNRIQVTRRGRGEPIRWE